MSDVSDYTDPELEELEPVTKPKEMKMGKSKQFGDMAVEGVEGEPEAAPLPPTPEEIQSAHDDMRLLQDEKIAANAEAEKEAAEAAKPKS